MKAKSCRACGFRFAPGGARPASINVPLCRECASNHVWFCFEDKVGARHVHVMRDGVELRQEDIASVVVRLRYWAAAARQTARTAPVMSAAPDELRAYQEGRADGIESTVEALRAAFFPEGIAEFLPRSAPALDDVLVAIDEERGPPRPTSAYNTATGGWPRAPSPEPPEVVRRPPPPVWPVYTAPEQPGPAVSRLELLRRRARGD